MATSMSMVKRTRQAKLQAMAGALAIQIAKERQDPLYKKFKRFRDKYWSMKRRIKTKYGQKAMVSARDKMAKSK